MHTCIPRRGSDNQGIVLAQALGNGIAIHIKGTIGAQSFADHFCCCFGTASARSKKYTDFVGHLQRGSGNGNMLWLLGHAGKGANGVHNAAAGDE